jgi:hypothetical protein
MSKLYAWNIYTDIEFPHAMSTIVVLDLTYLILMNKLLCLHAKQSKFLTKQIHSAISCLCTATKGLIVLNRNRGRREGRERTSCINTDGDVASAEELAIDAELRGVGPVEYSLHPCRSASLLSTSSISKGASSDHRTCTVVWEKPHCRK